MVEEASSLCMHRKKRREEADEQGPHVSERGKSERCGLWMTCGVRSTCVPLHKMDFYFYHNRFATSIFSEVTTHSSFYKRHITTKHNLILFSFVEKYYSPVT
jgi:hypothetical protein